MTTISERQLARFIYTKSQTKLRNVLYKKHDTLQKARQFPFRFNIQKARHFTLRNVYENVEGGIYIQEAWHFALHVVFIYKKLDTSKKARQFALRFYIKNPDTLHYAVFHWIFEIGGGGGGILFCKKQYTLRFICICKMQCTLRYIFISKIYRIVLIPNYKRTYDQRDQTKK